MSYISCEYIQTQYGELLTKRFGEYMYKNLWSFITPELISNILNILGLENVVKSYKIEKSFDEVSYNNYTFFKMDENKMYRNSICFIGLQELNEGHYLYVNNQGNVYGTYEKELLTKFDDGICHGAAIIFALGSNKHKLYNKFKLINFPKSFNSKKKNYINILSFYKYLIEENIIQHLIKIKGKNQNEKIRFFNNVNTYLTNYINRLENLDKPYISSTIKVFYENINDDNLLKSLLSIEDLVIIASTLDIDIPINLKRKQTLIDLIKQKQDIIKDIIKLENDCFEVNPDTPRR